LKRIIKAFYIGFKAGLKCPYYKNPLIEGFFKVQKELNESYM